MPPLSRAAAPLLRTVAGRQHARAERYDGDFEVEQARGTTEELRDYGNEEDIYGPPLSSGDEAPPPVKRASPPQPPTTRVPPKPAKSSSSEAVSMDREPIKRKLDRIVKPRVPAKGSYAKNMEERERRRETKGDVDEDKENEELNSSKQSEAGKRNVEEDDKPKWWGQGGQKKQRTTKSDNIHAHPVHSTSRTKKVVSYGTSRENATSSRPLISKKPKTFSRKDKPPLSETILNDATSDSDDSLAELDQLKSKTKPISTPEPTPKNPTKRTKRSLLEIAEEIRPNQKLASSQLSGSQTASLPNLDPYISGKSTPLSSLDSLDPPGPSLIAPDAAIRDLEQYLADLPDASEATSKCTICEETVDPLHYTEFWEGKRKTVQHQTLFCKEHKKRKALEEYKKNGYPHIDWDAFPDKIQQYHPDLIAVLRNTKSSRYRDLHAQRLADRDERTVRKLIDSDAIFQSTTGYYGSRGQRAMMEAIVSELGPVIRECVKSDPVVAFNGIANFVQAVLVPELTIWMVMDDKSCSEAKAREIVQQSGALGEVVHEEVEDRVRVVESEESSAED